MKNLEGLKISTDLVNELQRLRKENDELRFRADRDNLTGCLRRDAFVSLIEKRRAFGLIPSHMTLAVIDVDHFKSINDRYGHAVGDQVLREISSLLMNEAPEGALVCRMGGEEFVVLLPECLSNSAEQMDLLREKLSRTEISAQGTRLKATVSIGLANWKTEEESLMSATVAADKALYNAKNSGRNRIRIAA